MFSSSLLGSVRVCPRLRYSRLECLYLNEVWVGILFPFMEQSNSSVIEYMLYMNRVLGLLLSLSRQAEEDICLKPWRMVGVSADHSELQ